MSKREVPPESDNAADVDMPWAPRDHEWTGHRAEHDALEWAKGDPNKLASVYLYRDPKGDPALEKDYKFPVADIIDGKPTRVFRAVANAAARLDQADISAADRDKVKHRISELYRDAADAFDDPELRAPWDR
ncbi:hypothetical protein [Nocardia caishijiensis]|uniref:Uncharacterized protein n=1 Tax=Nocardia caishijiensis TaxID=184756 RepID=A0ABQ6YL85_9NOCA|nr:hypothetical protein [Nocardia caishijiensis]KAF0846555.1 hypothetical protein FNL39_105471 [Nocardia caishijiensis]